MNNYPYMIFWSVLLAGSGQVTRLDAANDSALVAQPRLPDRRLAARPLVRCPNMWERQQRILARIFQIRLERESQEFCRLVQELGGVNVRLCPSMTLLMILIQAGRFDLAQYLIEHEREHVNLNEVSRRTDSGAGMTALDYAESLDPHVAGRDEFIEFLRHSGALRRRDLPIIP